MTKILQQELKAFYWAVHKCFKGRGKSQAAWQVIEYSLESTQDDGTQFVLEKGDDEVWQCDVPRLMAVFAAYDMPVVEVAEGGGG